MPPLDIQQHASHRVAFRTIGCKLNQCETAQMQEIVPGRGLPSGGLGRPRRHPGHQHLHGHRQERPYLPPRDPPGQAPRPGVRGCRDRLLRPGRSGGGERHPRSGPGLGQHGQAAAGGAGDRGAGSRAARRPHPDDDRRSPSPALGALTEPGGSATTSSSPTSTATPGPSSRSRPAATPAAPTASSPWPADRRAACPGTGCWNR